MTKMNPLWILKSKRHYSQITHLQLLTVSWRWVPWTSSRSTKRSKREPNFSTVWKTWSVWSRRVMPVSISTRRTSPTSRPLRPSRNRSLTPTKPSRRKRNRRRRKTIRWRSWETCWNWSTSSSQWTIGGRQASTMPSWLLSDTHALQPSSLFLLMLRSPMLS